MEHREVNANKGLIRKAQKEDIKKLVFLDEKSFKKPWSKKSFEEELSNNYSQIKIFAVQSRIYGFICYRIFLEELHIFRICAERMARRKKISTRLLADAEEDASGKAFQALLEVESSNTPALNFYNKNSFIVTGIRKNYYGEGVDALNMTKDLSGGLK